MYLWTSVDTHTFIICSWTSVDTLKFLYVHGSVYPWTCVDTHTLIMGPWKQKCSIIMDQCGHLFTHHVFLDPCDTCTLVMCPWTSFYTCTLVMCPWTSFTLVHLSFVPGPVLHLYTCHVSLDQCDICTLIMCLRTSVDTCILVTCPWTNI